MKINPTAKQAQGVIVNGVTKTSFNDYCLCQAKAYKKLREPVSYEASAGLSLGLFGHDMAEAQIYAMQGDDSKLAKVYEKYSPSEIAKGLNDLMGLKYLSQLVEGLSEIKTEFNFKLPMNEVEDGFNLYGRFDCIGLMQFGADISMRLIEFKTGFVMDETIDNEAMIYIYAAFRQFGMPIIFTRYSLRTGKTYTEALTTEQIESYGKIIISNFKKYKADMSATNEPKIEPGKHCVNCPFILTCSARNMTVNTYQEKLIQLAWAQNLVKKLNTDLKNAGKELLKDENSPLTDNEERTIIPGTAISVVATSSVSYQSPTRSVKKADIIKQVIDSGIMAEYPYLIERVDMSFDEDSAEILRSKLGIDLKKVSRTNIKITDCSDDEFPEGGSDE